MSTYPTLRGPAPHRACCGHSDAWHIDMKDGYEKCAGCDCRTPTGTVDDTKEHDLTPSEVALARVLGAWEEWDPPSPEIPDEQADTIDDVAHVLTIRGLIDGDQLTATGQALLDRARKAGVVGIGGGE